MSRPTFPKFLFAGSHRQIGQQHGEAARDLIHRHLAIVKGRLQERLNLTSSAADSLALQYRPYVQKYAGFLDEEVQGVAEGAGLTLGEAYVLQLRAELAKPRVIREVEAIDECTSYAVLAEGTSDGKPLLGQNADLPGFYTDLCIVMELRHADKPNVLMVTPAGQVSYLGLNDSGLAVGANFLSCDGWRFGVPRYFFSRIALTTSDIEAAIRKVEALDRASSRNLILLDSHNQAADVEFTPTHAGRLEPHNGLLAHANHFLSPELLAEERAPARSLGNSRLRQERMDALLRERHGSINVEVMQEILRNRDGAPDALCRVPGESELEASTIASIISRPTEADTFIAAGPPHESDFVHYTFSD